MTHPHSLQVAVSGLLVLLSACSARFDIYDDPAQPPRSAVQTIYQNGVPHTDGGGNLRFRYDAAKSFLPIGVYHALHGRHFGRDYSLGDIAKAGFNMVHFWEGQRVGAVIDAARRHGLKLIPHYPTDDEIRRLANDPTILGWYLDEEPTQFFPSEEQPKVLAAFELRYRQIRHLGARQPIFVVDRRPMSGRMAEWDTWATIGDVSSHFTYPFVDDVIHTLDRRLSISAGLTRAVSLNTEKKPVWFVAQAFSGLKGWHMPSPRLLRAMTYTALIHGATGIIYFGLDSFVMRHGDVVGMAPSPLADYGETEGFGRSGVSALKANAADLEGSRILWGSMPRLIRELKILKPDVLSPTSRRAYFVNVEGEPLSQVPVRTILKRAANGHVLIAVNLDDVPLTVTISFGVRPSAVMPMFAPPSTPQIIARGLRLKLEGFGVRVLRIQLPELAVQVSDERKF